MANLHAFMPVNIVIYDRNARFNKHKMSFSRKFRPIVGEMEQQQGGMNRDP
jgi:hypothetical protein